MEISTQDYGYSSSNLDTKEKVVKILNLKVIYKKFKKQIIQMIIYFL